MPPGAGHGPAMTRPDRCAPRASPKSRDRHAAARYQNYCHPHSSLHLASWCTTNGKQCCLAAVGGRATIHRISHIRIPSDTCPPAYIAVLCCAVLLANQDMRAALEPADTDSDDGRAAASNSACRWLSGCVGQTTSSCGCCSCVYACAQVIPRRRMPASAVRAASQQQPARPAARVCMMTSNSSAELAHRSIAAAGSHAHSREREQDHHHQPQPRR